MNQFKIFDFYCFKQETFEIIIKRKLIKLTYKPLHRSVPCVHLRDLHSHLLITLHLKGIK